MMYPRIMTQLEAVRYILTLHCSESSRLASESLDRPLELAEALAWRLHGLICTSCRRYHGQLLALRKIAGDLALRSDSPSPSLPDDVRERIKRSLRDN